jgi:hypothetical protein
VYMRVGIHMIPDYRGYLDRKVADLIPLNRSLCYREVKWLKDVAHRLRNCSLREFTAAAVACLGKIGCVSHVAREAVVNFVAIHHPCIERSAIIDVLGPMERDELLSVDSISQGVGLDYKGRLLLNCLPGFERRILRLPIELGPEMWFRMKQRTVLDVLYAAGRNGLDAQQLQKRAGILKASTWLSDLRKSRNPKLKKIAERIDELRSGAPKGMYYLY